MVKTRFGIGVLSKRTGVAVKTLRFYSDEGLLPPLERSRARYRLYGDESVARVDLIRTLREAGVDLATVEEVLGRKISLGDALRLRLATVEAHAASLQRVAAAIRAALRHDPTEEDLRRLHAVTQLSNEQKKQKIAEFYRRVSEGLPVDEKWMQAMIDASAPKLPDSPTPAQLDAWIELAEIVGDAEFVARMREMAKETWQKGLDVAAMKQVNDEAAAAAKAARESGLAPSSPEGKALVERYVEGLAAAGNKAADPTMKARVKDRFLHHDPRASRYWELVAILNGRPPTRPGAEDWDWISKAVIYHL